MTSERIWALAGWISRRLISCAAQRTPDSLSARLEEEWLSDAAARCGDFSRLRFACGCCWAALVIANEQATVAVSATSSPVTHGRFIRFPREEFPFFAGSSETFVLIVALFAALLYGLAIGLK